MPTTPRQIKREKSGLLVPFSDVVAPWNLTSFVFKNVFSLHVVGEKGEWCDYPLFPSLFRKAGYHVTFITNQFLPKAKQAVYDFSGGFFLNHPELSAAMFDSRNQQLYRFDRGLLDDYDKISNNTTPIIILSSSISSDSTSNITNVSQATVATLRQKIMRRNVPTLMENSEMYWLITTMLSYIMTPL